MNFKNRKLFNVLILMLVIPIFACGGGSDSSPVEDLSEIDGKTNVAVDSSFEYVFSKAVDVDTVDTSTFFIFPTNIASTSISKSAFDEDTYKSTYGLNTTVDCDSDSKCALDPTDDLSPGTSYTVCLSTSILYASTEAFEGFCATFNTSEISDSCNLSLSYAGPTEAYVFADFEQEEINCSFNSWKEALGDEKPDSSAIFVSSNCGGDKDGSIEKPFCDMNDALVEASKIYDSETTPSIYIDPGEYATNITLKGELPGLKIKGLCSETTILSQKDSEKALIQADSSMNVLIEINNITLQGKEKSIMTLEKGKVHLNQVHIEQNIDNSCFVVSGTSSLLEGESVNFSGPIISPVPVTPITSGSNRLVMPIGTNELIPRCILVEDGGNLILDNFYFHDFAGIAIQVTDSDSKANLSDGVIENIYPVPNGNYPSQIIDNYGYGISIKEGASGILDQVSFNNCYGTHLIVDGSDTSVSINNSYFGQVTENLYGATGVGIIIQNEALGNVAFSKFENAVAPGIFLSNSSSTIISDSYIIGNTFANIALSDADLTLSRTYLGLALAHPSEGGPINLFIQGKSGNTTTANISNNIITGNSCPGIYIAEGAEGEMNLIINGNNIDENSTTDSVYSPHVLMTSLIGNIVFSNNCIKSGSVTEPSGLIVDTSSGMSISDNTYEGTFGNYVIQQQRCPDPTNDSFDTSSETFPPSTVNCICGVLSDTGDYCEPTGIGPIQEYYFTIGEIEPVE